MPRSFEEFEADFNAGRLPPKKKPNYKAERIALWAICPPVGFWRSYRHGRNEANEKLARDIARNIKNND